MLKKKTPNYCIKQQEKKDVIYPNPIMFSLLKANPRLFQLRRQLFLHAQQLSRLRLSPRLQMDLIGGRTIESFLTSGQNNARFVAQLGMDCDRLLHRSTNGDHSFLLFFFNFFYLKTSNKNISRLST